MIWEHDLVCFRMLLGRICHYTNVLYDMKMILAVFGQLMTENSWNGDICREDGHANMTHPQVRLIENYRFDPCKNLQIQNCPLRIFFTSLIFYLIIFLLISWIGLFLELQKIPLGLSMMSMDHDTWFQYT